MSVPDYWNDAAAALASREPDVVASINEPCTRGADHASLERRLVGDRDELKALTAETDHEISPRWAEELQATGHHLIGLIDNRALGQARQLFADRS